MNNSLKIKFCFVEPEIGMLDWSCIRIECYLCKAQNSNYVLHCAKFFEWQNRVSVTWFLDTVQYCTSDFPNHIQNEELPVADRV